MTIKTAVYQARLVSQFWESMGGAKSHDRSTGKKTKEKALDKMDKFTKHAGEDQNHDQNIKQGHTPELWDGKAAKRIVECLADIYKL